MKAPFAWLDEEEMEQENIKQLKLKPTNYNKTNFQFQYQFSPQEFKSKKQSLAEITHRAFVKRQQEYVEKLHNHHKQRLLKLENFDRNNKQSSRAAAEKHNFREFYPQTISGAKCYSMI